MILFAKLARARPAGPVTSPPSSLNRCRLRYPPLYQLLSNHRSHPRYRGSHFEFQVYARMHSRRTTLALASALGLWRVMRSWVKKLAMLRCVATMSEGVGGGSRSIGALCGLGRRLGLDEVMHRDWIRVVYGRVFGLERARSSLLHRRVKRPREAVVMTL